MELNVKEQTEKLQGEITQLAGELQQMPTPEQLNQMLQARQEKINVLIKKQGALELLQSLTPEEKPAKVDKKE